MHFVFGVGFLLATVNPHSKGWLVVCVLCRASKNTLKPLSRAPWKKVTAKVDRGWMAKVNKFHSTQNLLNTTQDRPKGTPCQLLHVVRTPQQLALI